MLAPTETPRHRAVCILVAEVSGVGKSTVCQRISDAIGFDYPELDSLFHGPKWVPRAGFFPDVAALSSGDRWVAEYSALVTTGEHDHPHPQVVRLRSKREIDTWLNRAL